MFKSIILKIELLIINKYYICINKKRMETYKLNQKEVIEELHNKLLDNYVIREITIFCNEIINISKLQDIIIKYNDYPIDYFPNFTFIDNQITFYCYSKICSFYDCRYFDISDLDIKYINVKIEISNLFISKFDDDMFYYGNEEEIYDEYTITSNYFNNITTIINYYKSISIMTNKQIFEYLFKTCDNINLINSNTQCNEDNYIII